MFFLTRMEITVYGQNPYKISAMETYIYAVIACHKRYTKKYLAIGSNATRDIDLRHPLYVITCVAITFRYPQPNT